MKIVKADDVELNEQPTTPAIDPAVVQAAQDKFDLLRNQLDSKEYAVELSTELTSFLFDVFYSKVSWKGYESYAIAETFDQLKSAVQGDTLNGTIKPEIIEAIFHFLKNHVGVGITDARGFKELCDVFAIPMKELNEDRQSLRDASLEVVAAEQGITVENLVENAQKAQAAQAQAQQYQG